jgi:hypothetical protein
VQKTGNRKQLETYGSQGHLGGWITSFCQGRTIDCLLMDGTWLILRFCDGHEARIGWQDASGNQLKGSPFLENLDVRVQLVGACSSGVGGDL